MAKVLTIRMDEGLLGRAEERAAQLGLDRGKYVRQLIEEDLVADRGASQPTFVSEDLAGMYEGTGRPATNTEVRARLRSQAHGKAALEQ